MSGAVPAAPPGGRAEAALARLHGLHPRLIDLSLGRMHAVLAALGHPERRLPPVVHVAGTNGKGSTCAFLRAAAEAAGLRVHAYTSPHLVEFRERVRLAGTLADDAALEMALAHVEAVNAGAPLTVFEAITGAAFHLFAAVPADLLVLEVGLGGRFDATNVVDRPAACAVASVSLDHQDFLGHDLGAIAAEKAGILKPGVPAATGAQAPAVLAVLDQAAAAAGTRVRARDRDWRVAAVPGGLRYEDAAGVLALPPPGLAGPHQADNAGIAVAALRAWDPPWLTDAALAAGVAAVSWPGRLQRLRGPLAGLLPDGWELWLDGGHNPGAGAALAAHAAAAWADRPLHLLAGLKQGKDPGGVLRPLLPRAASAWAVAEPGQHLAMAPEAIVAAVDSVRPGSTVAATLARLPRGGPPARVLILGSLYLAGEVLRMDMI